MTQPDPTTRVTVQAVTDGTDFGYSLELTDSAKSENEESARRVISNYLESATPEQRQQRLKALHDAYTASEGKGDFISPTAYMDARVRMFLQGGVTIEDRIERLRALAEASGVALPDNPRASDVILDVSLETLKQVEARFETADKLKRNSVKIQEFIDHGTGLDHVQLPGSTRAERLAAMAIHTGLSPEDIEKMAKDPSAMAEELYEMQSLAAVMHERARVMKWVLSQHNRAPWTEALDMLYIARAGVSKALGNYNTQQGREAEGKHAIRQVWASDLEALRAAECYSWGSEPVRACFQASQSVPREAVLQVEHVLSPAGWWYFGNLLPVKPGLGTDTTLALSWRALVVEG